MKPCIKCKNVKALSEFYTHEGMADGHLNKCKACCRADATANRNKNIERIRAYDRARGNRQSPDYRKEWRGKYPNKYRAHNIVNRAIRSRKLFAKPCEECGCDKTHAHHDDYLEPLNVRWLCPACHKKWHNENGEGLNAK